MNDTDTMPVCPRKPSLRCVPGPSYGDCCRITPNSPVGFSVIYRNPDHWDIYTAGRGGRAFRIRGEPNNVMVFDEREMDGLPSHPRDVRYFRTVSTALAWCADELMMEAQK